MEQFHAYENTGAGKKTYPYLINMQHPIADVLKHALVIPVIECELLGAMPPEKICPVVTIQGQTCVAMTHMMAGIPIKELGASVADLTYYRDDLCGAVDFMIQGY
ncbi:CcdB family protein [Cedecea sp.]|jgi:toxin CcdB|uniref:CcdB family protein n=1 Tax=Cedecea sp. TaxID=1970739 RepID=UPI0012ADD18F|nr:taxon MazF [Enterobacteriaceae bacterium RIT693]